MIVLNYSHPLTDEQKSQIESYTRSAITVLYENLPHFDSALPMTVQIETLVENTPLTPHQWQTESILINPPGLAGAAAALLANLHGRMGYFPATLYIRPVRDAVPVRYEVAEIINLQEVRNQAREKRVKAKE
ncbi:MAG: CRISPR-associated protein Csx15 [Chloroflexota bacterium]